MSPHQPDLLADWLRARLEGGDPHLPPPAGLDPDVVEAVDAIRPDLVPIPEGALRAALADLLVGPLAAVASQDEQTQAAALAAALEQPDTLDPAQISADAYAALAALNPDTLPVPALEVEDLFGEVPSVEERAGDVGLEEGSPPASVTTALPEPAPANRRRWLLPGLSALAMAMAVLLMVIPATPELLNQEPPFPAAVEAPFADDEELFVAHDASEAVGQVELEVAAADLQQEPAARGVATPAPAASPPAEQPSVAPAPHRPSPKATQVDHGALEPEPEPTARKAAPDSSPRQAAPEPPLPPSAGTTAPPAPDAVRGGMLGGASAVGRLGTRGKRSDTVAAPAGFGGMAGTREAAAGLDEGGARGAPLAANPEADDAMGLGRLDRAVASASQPSSQAKAPPSPLRRRRSLEEERAAEAPAGAGLDDLDALRRQVLALVAPSRPTPGLPDDLAAYGALDAAEAQGDPAAQRAALRILAGSAQPDVVADAHLRLAAFAAGNGASGRALALLARGLGTVGVAPGWRAQLLGAQGRVLERRGDLAGARRSYEQALVVR